MATLSFANMQTVKTCQYGGEEKSDMWAGCINNTRNYRAGVYFTPAVALTSVTFSLYCNHYVNYKNEKGKYEWDIVTGGEVVISKGEFTASKGARTSFSLEYNFQPGIQYLLYIGAPWDTWNYGIKFSGTNVQCTSTVASFTVTYDANGGTTTKTNETGSSFTMPTTSECSRPGYQLLGWATSSTAAEAEYLPGAIVSFNSAMTLYAIWSLSVCHLYLATSANTYDKHRVYIYSNGAWGLYNPHIYTNGMWIPTESITQAPNYETPDMSAQIDMVTHYTGLSLSSGTTTGTFYLGYMSQNYHWLQFKFTANTMASSLKFSISSNRVIDGGANSPSYPWKLKLTEAPIDPDGDTTATTHTIYGTPERGYYYIWTLTGLNLIQGKTYYLSVWAGSGSQTGGLTGGFSHSITLNPSN